MLFADIAGFTPLSSSLPPEQVVQTLNTLFSRFDALTSARGLERSRPSATATWWSVACRIRAPITPRRWPIWRWPCSPLSRTGTVC